MACRNHVEVEEGVRPCSRCGAFFCGDCLVDLQGRSYCAGCKTEQLLDLRSGTDHWNLEYANIGRRFVALWIDQFIFAMSALLIVGGGVAISALFDKPGSNSPLMGIAFGVGVLLAIAGLVTYEALMTGKRNGQTLGKMALKIRVVRPDGSPISMGQAWGRAITRILFVHILQLINYAPAFFTKEKTCVHDLLAKTRVVRAE